MFEVDSISRSVSLREEGHTISDNSFREDTTYETNACPLVSDFFWITNYEQKGKNQSMCIRMSSASFIWNSCAAITYALYKSFISDR